MHSTSAPPSPSIGEPVPLDWPAEISDDLRDILGMMCFQLGDIAHAYRIGGHTIKTRAEDEQAFMLHRMVLAWAKAGPLWRDEIQSELEEMRDRLAGGEPA